MKDWLKIKADQLLPVLLISLSLALGTHGPTGKGPSRDIFEGSSVPETYSDLSALTTSATHLAGVREEKDRVIYRAKSGERVRQPRMPTPAQGIQRRDSWDTLRDNVIEERSKKEPSLTFPRDDISPPRN
jgi:hypothetical protein